MIKIGTFGSDQRGSVAVIFGLSIFAMVGTTALAVDLARAYGEGAALLQASDAAALAGAAVSDGDAEQRTAMAVASFVANYKSRTGATATPVVQVSGSRVMVSATARVPMTFARVIGFETLEVPAESEAEAAQGAPARVCLLALNPTAASGISLQGDARLVATNCWAWSNSGTSGSISGNGTTQASAAGFCAAGGISGPEHFSPAPRGNCPAVADPFANLIVPSASACTATNLNLGPGTHVLEPGTYCGGINAQASATVTFNPGTYVVKDGPLGLAGQSVSVGNGVAFYFTGSAAQVGLQIQGGASVDFKAPTSGELAGFVFVQDKYSQPGVQSRIAGGAHVKLEGILYMPTWVVNVTGNGSMFQEAITWSMVADSFIISGQGDITIKADPVAAGLPDNLLQARTWLARLTR
ncbi:MAG: hypothetical protein ACKVP7_19200 [Hyphomicrobiaceae bacterium]